MQFRPLGKTGLNLSVVSFGAASMGNEYGNAADEARSIRALHVALDGGLNFIDTSPFYGRGMSEVLLGIELTCRLGLATKLNLVEGGWIYTALLGHFGATLAAARLIDPRPQVIRNALGIVYCLASGNHQSTREGAQTKHVQPGFAAANAITAALMASQGLPGVQHPLTGEDGLNRVYLHERFDAARALEGLGVQWEFDPRTLAQIGAYVAGRGALGPDIPAWL